MIQTIFAVIGLILLAILAVILIGVLWFFFRFRYMLRKAMRGEPLGSGTPQTIHMNEVSDRDWLDEDEVSEALSVMKNRGYREGKIYEVAEMPSVLLLSMENPENGTVGAIFLHPVAGVWAELIAEKEDGYITFSNCTTGAISTFPDWAEVHFLDAPAEEVVSRFETRIQGVPLKVSTAENFRKNYEAAYKKVMKWINASGGVTFEQVKAQNARMPRPLPPERLDEAFLSVKIAEFGAWEMAMIEELRQTEGFAFPEEELFIVPDFAHCEAFADYVTGRLELTDKQADEFRRAARNRMDCGPFFDELIRRLSEGLRPREIARITFPLDARVFSVNETVIHRLDEE